MQTPRDGRLPPPLDVLWRPRKPGKTSARGGGLSLDGVVRAAVALADEGGLAAVSMARLAKQLGVTPMALYRHVRSKDELVALMVEEATAYPEHAGEQPPDWRAGLDRWSWSLLEVVRRHPWLLEVALPRLPFGPRRLAWLEGGLAALTRTALGEHEKAAIVLLLNGYVFSQARLSAEVGEEAGNDVGPAREHGVQLSDIVDAEQFPALSRALEAGIFDPVASDRDADFSFGLDRVLDGVERLVDQRARETD